MALSVWVATLSDLVSMGPSMTFLVATLGESGSMGTVACRISLLGVAFWCGCCLMVQAGCWTLVSVVPHDVGDASQDVIDRAGS